MLDVKGHKLKVKYITQDRCKVYLDGFEIRNAIDIKINESATVNENETNKLANVVLTIIPSEILIYPHNGNDES